jgi:tricorn protease
LHDVIAEMFGELATSHTYVWGGDRGLPVPMVQTGLLGADLVREEGAFRVARIHRGAAADRVRSPLDEPGSTVKEGEYILAVDNQSVPAERPFESALAGRADKPVLLTVNDKASREGARTVVVTPLGQGKAARLLYHDWVRRNREHVTEKTGGRIGYIHIPDMGGRGLKEFDTWFYQQLDKDGMVVDARWNGGGFVSQLMVARFLRSLLWWDRGRWGGVSTYPYRLVNGPFVVLTNEFAGSDGDIFPEAIQTAKLAPIIGKRSWGGVIGIRGGRALVDRGAVTSPEFAWWHPTKGWGIENHGVDPDIVVENLPQELGRGIDAQLDRGIAEVLRLREKRPPLKPEFGPAKDRSRRAFQSEK